MTSASDTSKTALIVVDVQEDVARNGHDADQVIANINTLVAQARQQNQPVVWIQHAAADLAAGSDGWQIVHELKPAPGESVIHKNYGDSFEATDLQSILAKNEVGTVVITGAQTEWCIRSTLHGALARGFNTTLVSDAHTTDDLRDQGATLSPQQMIDFTNGYWKYTDAPDRTCAVVATSDVTF